jgi:hypothetical protein
MLRETVRIFQAERNALDQRSLRAYREGELDESAKETLLNTPIDNGETFEAWMRRALPGTRFGLIINGFERWAEPVAHRMLAIFAPLLSSWGIPQTSIELTLFAGNYGYTPFGIHIDDPFTHTVHFQLGPGSKTMTLWTPERFHELNGPSKRSKDYARLLPYGESTLVRACDVYLLPPHYYHVAAAQEFSIGIAACIGRFPPNVLRARAMRGLMATPAFARFLDGPGGQDILPEDLTLRAALNLACEELAAGERSKAGLKHLSRKRYSNLLEFQNIELRKGFPIEVLHRGSKLVIYARGHRLQARALPALRDLLERLHSGERIGMRTLSSLYLGVLDRLAVTNLLRELERCGALQTMDSNPRQIGSVANLLRKREDGLDPSGADHVRVQVASF